MYFQDRPTDPDWTEALADATPLDIHIAHAQLLYDYLAGNKGMFKTAARVASGQARDLAAQSYGRLPWNPTLYMTASNFIRKAGQPDALYLSIIDALAEALEDYE